MAVRGEGRPLHACVTVHTTYISIFTFTMFTATTSPCNYCSLQQHQYFFKPEINIFNYLVNFENSSWKYQGILFSLNSANPHIYVSPLSYRNALHICFRCRAEGRLSDMVSQVTLMQNSFQCLIVGSAVDWAVDDRLCELMVSLGKPLNMQLDDLHDSDVRSDVDTSH